MTDRVIDVDAPTSRLLLDGGTEWRQPVTRRTSNVNGGGSPHREWASLCFGSRDVRIDSCLHVPVGSGDWKGCVYRVRPRIEVGDRLRVREPWVTITGNGHRIVYRADGERPARIGYPDDPMDVRRWERARDLPRRSIRLELEVVSTRPEKAGREAWTWVYGVKRRS